jgi:hypothetical protein
LPSVGQPHTQAATLGRPLPTPLVTAVGLLPSAITMTTDPDAAALWTQLEAIVKEDEGAEEKAVAARLCVQAARLLEEEETKVAALEQTTTAARQCLPSSSVVALASQFVLATQSSPAFTFRRLRFSTSASW